MDIFWSKFRILASISLLVIIVIRLMWLDVRPRPTKVEPRLKSALTYGLQKSNYQTSLDFCGMSNVKKEEKSALRYSIWFPSKITTAIINKSILEPCLSLEKNYKDMLRSNKYVLISLIFLLAVFARALTQSWLIAMIVVASMLSSSHIVPYNSVIGLSLYGQVFATLWCLALAFYCREGKKISLFLFSMISSIGVVFGFYSLALTPLLIIPLFALQKPYFYSPKTATKSPLVFLYLTLYLLVISVGLFYINMEPQYKMINVGLPSSVSFAQLFAINIDAITSFKFAASFGLIVMCCFIKPSRQMQKYYNFNCMFALGFLGILLSTWLGSYLSGFFGIYTIDMLMVNHFEWFLPIIMTLGLTSLYYQLQFIKNLFLNR